MYPQADSVVRNLMPAVLDVAGMGEAAASLRALGPLLSSADAEAACLVLASIRGLRMPEARVETQSRALWSDLVAEAAFWAEAAVRCALDGEKADFQFCVGRLRAEMDAAWGLLRPH
jgi:hypothetical protein